MSERGADVISHKAFMELRIQRVIDEKTGDQDSRNTLTEKRATLKRKAARRSRARSFTSRRRPDLSVVRSPVEQE
jgi:hypothetical protein